MFPIKTFSEHSKIDIKTWRASAQICPSNQVLINAKTMRFVGDEYWNRSVPSVLVNHLFRLLEFPYLPKTVATITFENVAQKRVWFKIHYYSLMMWTLVFQLNQAWQFEMFSYDFISETIFEIIDSIETNIINF